jgi:hypothetical protein
MRIVAAYSFNGGREVLEARFPTELRKIKEAIASVGSRVAPDSLNKALRKEFKAQHWQKQQVACEYPTGYYTSSYKPSVSLEGAFREIEFVMNRVGVEVYLERHVPGMVYDVCAQMTIFHNRGLIDAGVMIVPVEDFANQMSVSLSCFEQVVWDLEQRGVSNIDIPVLILGIAA